MIDHDMSFPIELAMRLGQLNSILKTQEFIMHPPHIHDL